MASPREIASAFVRIFVKKDGLKADLQQVEQQVRATTDKTQAEATKAGNAFNRMGRELKSSLGLGLFAAVTGSAAALGGLVAIANRLIGAFTQTKDLSDDMRKSLEAALSAANAAIDKINGIQFTGQSNEVRGLNQQIEALQGRLKELQGVTTGGFFDQFVGGGGGAALVQNEMQRLIRKREELERAESKKREADRQAAIDKAAKEEAEARQEEEKRLEVWRDQQRKEREAKDLAAIQAKYAAEREAAESLAAFQQQLIDQLQQSLQGVADGGSGIKGDIRILTGLLEEVRDSIRG